MNIWPGRKVCGRHSQRKWSHPLVLTSERSERFCRSVKKMIFSNYKKQRVLAPSSKGLKAPTITKELQQENLKCSRVGLRKFLLKFKETGLKSRRVASGRPSKVTAEIKQIVEQMCKDDETTAYQLHHLLSEKGYSISLHTILQCRTTLDWTYRGSTYSQTTPVGPR